MGASHGKSLRLGTGKRMNFSDNQWYKWNPGSVETGQCSTVKSRGVGTGKCSTVKSRGLGTGQRKKVKSRGQIILVKFPVSNSRAEKPLVKNPVCTGPSWWTPRVPRGGVGIPKVWTAHNKRLPFQKILSLNWFIHFWLQKSTNRWCHNWSKKKRCF